MGRASFNGKPIGRDDFLRIVKDPSGNKVNRLQTQVGLSGCQMEESGHKVASNLIPTENNLPEGMVAQKTTYPKGWLSLKSKLYLLVSGHRINKRRSKR